MGPAAFAPSPFSSFQCSPADPYLSEGAADTSDMVTATAQDGLKAPRPPTVEHVARLVGMRRFSTPTLAGIDRRRSQLWTLAFSGLVLLAASTAVLTSGDDRDLGLASTGAFRFGTVALMVALAAYVMEKEHHLRLLAQMLISERVAAAAMADRLKELETLHASGTAMNSLLLIEEVLKLILSSAFELLQPLGASIMLLEGSDTLAVVCAVGHGSVDRARTKVGEGLAGRVALARAPILVQGQAADGQALPAESAVCAPLIHRGQLFGVLNLSGSTDRVYTDYDLQSVSLFAGHAAIAIANARLYDTERELNEKLSEAQLR